MNSLIYVPGQWVCDVCKSVYEKMFLRNFSPSLFVYSDNTCDHCSFVRSRELRNINGKHYWIARADLPPAYTENPFKG